VQKVLETANIKLSSVATDVLGKSGRDRLSALIEGTPDAEILAELARGKLPKQLPQLQQALDGRVQAHHRLLLKHLLAHITFLQETLEQLQQEIEPRHKPTCVERFCKFEQQERPLIRPAPAPGAARCPD
jgi:transposase